MSDTKFTPGLWTHGDESNSSAEICIGSTIAVIDREDPNTGIVAIDREEMRANAHLIAAAPDLYGALTTLLLIVGLTAFKHEGQREVLQEAVDHGYEALRKARGES